MKIDWFLNCFSNSENFVIVTWQFIVLYLSSIQNKKDNRAWYTEESMLYRTEFQGEEGRQDKNERGINNIRKCYPWKDIQDDNSEL